MKSRSLEDKLIVLDTNTVVSALLFRSGRLSWLRSEWQAGRMVPLVSNAIVKELLRVMSYPKFELSVAERDELLGEYLPFCATVEAVASPGLPKCRDESDQMFLEAAAAGGAQILVTGDRDLLELAGQLPFDVVTPAELRYLVFG